jgi:integrase
MQPVPFAQFEREVLDLYAPPCRKHKTLLQVRQVLREFGELAEVSTTADLDPRAISLWIASHPARSAVTITSLLRAMGPLLKYAVFKGWLERSPLDFRAPSKWVRKDVRPVKRPRPGSRSLGEMGAVLDLADAEAEAGGWRERRLRALVYVYAFLGLRAEEGQHLLVADVDLPRRVVTVQAHPEDGWTPKTLASAAVLPVAAPLGAVLAGWIAEADSRWLFPGTRRRGPWVHGGRKPVLEVKALGARAGVPGLTIAAFRKTVGTYAKTWGLGPLELKALLRHARVETQDWYDDSPVEAVRPAAERVAYPRIARAG